MALRHLAIVRRSATALRCDLIVDTWSLVGPAVAAPASGRLRLRLRVDRQTNIQLSTPRLGLFSAGHGVVESKKVMNQRGLKSPDRADAVLLSVFESEPISPPRRRGLLN
ncbi:hypothetical protein [Streptomyces sp. NPDC058385]|uniref:hypothetical protein n=1 Tax=Streptomyces sp. NPDC058385 TaxID=3346473 RepID=UPI0036529EC8